MNSNRRRFLLSGTALGASTFTGSVRALGSFPDHPITLIDSFAAGGSSDVFARVLAEKMASFLGGPVIVDNKPGAGGALGSEFVAKSKADGYTLGLATVSTLATAPAVNPKVRYDPLKDFAHITNVLTVPSVLVVHPSVNAKTLKELVQMSKDKPDTVSFATPGVGSAGHVLLEHFMQLSGAKFLHVPYKGSGPMINDLLGGQLMVASDNLPSMLPHIQSGKVRAIAVRDNKRLDSLANIPTYAEEGYPLVSEPLWFGLVAPAGTPRDIVMRLNLAAHQAIATPEFAARLKQAGAVAAPTTPEAFAAQARLLFERYKVVVREANIKLE